LRLAASPLLLLLRLLLVLLPATGAAALIFVLDCPEIPQNLKNFGGRYECSSNTSSSSESGTLRKKSWRSPSAMLRFLSSLSLSVLPFALLPFGQPRIGEKEPGVRGKVSPARRASRHSGTGLAGRVAEEPTPPKTGASEAAKVPVSERRLPGAGGAGPGADRSDPEDAGRRMTVATAFLSAIFLAKRPPAWIHTQQTRADTSTAQWLIAGPYRNRNLAASHIHSTKQ